MNRFKAILEIINDSKAEAEFSLARILAWNFFTEIEKIKDVHKSEIFILKKQILGLKEKLMNANSNVFEAKDATSISLDEFTSLNGTPVSEFRLVAERDRDLTPRVNITKERKSKVGFEINISKFKPKKKFNEKWSEKSPGLGPRIS